MRRHVFGPRRPVVSVPPPDLVVAQGAPGRALVFRPTEAVQATHFAGAVSISAPPCPRPPEVLRAPEVVARPPEPPPADAIAGRALMAQWGVAQPVQRPTAPVVARREEPPPEPGRALRSGARPPMDYRPTNRPLVARGGDAAPAEGRAKTTGIGSGVGFGAPRAPARPLVVAPEVRAPAPPPGAAAVAKPPPPNLTPQQPPGIARVAAAENAPPFAGWCLVRQRPLVPSDRLPNRALVARAEEPRPFAGLALAMRARLGSPPPARFVLTVARREEPLPSAGSATVSRPGVEARAPQQLPGRVVVAWVEEPRPDWVRRGQAIVLTGYRAGAVPPSSTGWRAGGAVRRADVQNRAVRRLPRMNGVALAYVTKTKTPSEALVLVFDYTNWPEIVGGATVASAIVTGPGGTQLTGLTAGTPAVLASAATIDQQGNTVAAQKGVQVTFFGGGVGDDVVVECQATFSTGDAPRCIQCKVAVRNAV